MSFMTAILRIFWGGIARLPPLTARGAVKDRRPPQAASASQALVLDGEHGVIR
jgi:hypothetical protein